MPGASTAAVGATAILLPVLAATVDAKRHTHTKRDH